MPNKKNPRLFSMNAAVPRNGDRDTHLRADGTRAPFYVFGILVAGAFVVAMAVWGIVWYIFRSSRRSVKKRGPAFG
ncbi:hypothetical protein JCM1841_001615 [Sporobolomyces salmonicolor]